MVFPPPNLADPDGLLAVGGDLSPERLLLAYRMGIFPWYSDAMPILWWSPDPRLVLIPGEFHQSRSLCRTIRKRLYHITADRAFAQVIRACSETRRPSGEGTWIVPEMIQAYVRLHELGYAHSVECWCGGELVGGLYGVALGGAFFGESMFARLADASKVAMAHLVDRLLRWEFELIDCQVTTTHLQSLGAREIARAEFLARLELALRKRGASGSWSRQF